MSLAYEKQEWSQHSVTEWMRLDGIAATHDRFLKTAFTRMVATGAPNRELVEDTITDCIVDTAASTARVYGINFNPSSPVYNSLLEELTDTYMKVIDNDSVRESVKQVMPKGMTLTERAKRLDTFGLDKNAAVRLEKMRQEGVGEPQINFERQRSAIQRGNLVALTEVNRIINATTEVLWLDNLSGISKARRKSKVEYHGEWFVQSGDTARKVTSLRGIPSRAHKTIVTRRDNRICNYCLPLEGEVASLGENFVTQYGLFKYPPFHPRCRCYMIVEY